MKYKKLSSALISGILAAAMVLGPVSHSYKLQADAKGQKSSSQIKSEIQSMKGKQDKIDSEISDIEDKISLNQGEINKTVENKELIDHEIFLLHEKINSMNEQIASQNLLIAQHQEKLIEAQSNLDALNRKNKQRIQSMEESGGLSYWSVLFKANSIADLLDRLVMIEDIAASDQRRLSDLRQAAKDVEDAKNLLEEEKKQLDAAVAELEASKADLDVKRKEADAILQELMASDAEYQDLLAEASSRNAEIDSEISKLESQYDEAKKREYQEWLAQQKPVVPPKPAPNPVVPETPNPPPATGGWLVPINYTMVSSPFGYRIHPILGTSRLHAGIDLAAPKGTPIVASRSGVVSTATYSSSAGYYVSINHMDGYSTRYMHMTHFVVSSGQKVQAGQLIGYCGSTGLSTGPHLHFGVYLNGTPINPAPFIGL